MSNNCMISELSRRTQCALRTSIFSTEISLNVLAFCFIFSHLIRMGIDLGEITKLFHVYPLLSREYAHTTDGKFTLAKNWSKISLAVAPITVIENITVHKRALTEHRTFESVFTRNSIVFMMNNVYYGSQGTVIDPTVRSGRLKSE